MEYLNNGVTLSREKVETLDDQPTFVVAAERSGSTMFRLMLDCHPTIACKFEMDYLVKPLANGAPELTGSEYCQFLQNDRIWRGHNFQVDTSSDYEEIANSMFDQLRKLTGKQIVIGVVHHHCAQLLRIWPKARCIHLVRDPRDVARSVVNFGWAGNVWAGCRSWIKAEEDWNVMCETIPPDRRINITYETLIGQPKSELKRICDFLGVDFDVGMLEYDRQSTYERPNSQLVEQWRHKLSERQIVLVEGRVGDLLGSRGYERHVDPSIEISSWGERWLRFDHRIRQQMHAITAVGLGAYLLHQFNRRLGTKIMRSWLDEKRRQARQRRIR